MSNRLVLANIGDLIALRDEFAAQLQAKQCDMADATSWEISNGRLSHIPPAFFDVVGVQVDETQNLLIQQSESAVVMLVQAVKDDERYYLISARAEPGLMRKCVITSTIQSTPSNLNRVHGGRATSYYEWLSDQSNLVQKIFESQEYDYGFIYANKHKTFQVLQVPELLKADESFAWVPESVLIEAMRIDNLVGTDLRVLLSKYLLLMKHNLKPDALANEPFWSQSVIEIENLANWKLTQSGIEEINHQQGFSVNFYQTNSPSREKTNWVQPLLSFKTNGLCGFWVQTSGDEVRYAVGQNNEIGIGASNVDTTSIHRPPGGAQPEAKPNEITAQVRADFEGGRFFETQYEVVLAESQFEDQPAGTSWMTEFEIAQRLVSNFGTTVEFRLAASLLLS